MGWRNSSCQTASERTILAFPSISCVGAGSCMSGHISVDERYILDEAGQNPKNHEPVQVFGHQTPDQHCIKPKNLLSS